MEVNGDTEGSVAAFPPGESAGAAGRRWFIAILNSRSEKATAERLTRLGVENYLPTQDEVRVWRNGRRARVERVVIPSVIFVRCTEPERREIVSLPYINRFMTNKAGSSAVTGGKPLATVSDDEIHRLKFMLGQSDIPVTITDRPYRVGDRARVVRGCLKGLEGEVIAVSPSQSELTIGLEHIGYARLVIDTVNMELI